MRWVLTHRMDQRCRKIADNHYNRQSHGSPKFVPPGRCVVLISCDDKAVWVTSWPYAQYVKHAWAGAWVNTLFRNEGDMLSSELILEAISATKAIWDPPELGLISFVDPSKIKSPNPGYCYKKAGFKMVGKTKRHELLAFQMLPDKMPEAKVPINGQQKIF